MESSDGSPLILMGAKNAKPITIELFQPFISTPLTLVGGKDAAPLEVPLWSGLTLQVLPQLPGHAQVPRPAAGDSRLPLKDLETELIRQAVQDARGNVMAAARRLGISRATVYRKLGQRGR